ncbi:unnamed protein product [Trichobilharzia regenti]|nr:unnamed protein product [Trichobilharzia regenti]
MPLSLPPGTRSPGSGSGYGTLRRLSKLGKELSTCQVKPRHPDTRLLECQSRPDRCPVRLYEAFCSHRPCSTTTIHSPFYLQPDRAAASIHYYHRQHPSSSSFSFSTNTNSSIWFTLNALGKNKIGSMLNGALQSIGMPVGRQVNLTRFCDSLIAAVLSLPSSSTSSSLNSNNNNNSISGGECDGDAGDLTREAYRVSEALRSILSNNRLIIPYQQIPESLQPTVTSLAEKVVQLSATRGSPIYNYLAKLSALKKSINNNNNNNKKTMNIDNQRPLKSSSSDSSLPTMVPMNIFYNSKHIDDCYR